jgi:hypothetical protein
MSLPRLQSPPVPWLTGRRETAGPSCCTVIWEASVDDVTRRTFRQVTHGTICATCERPITVARWRLSIDYIAEGGAVMDPTDSVFCSRACLNAMFDTPLPEE